MADDVLSDIPTEQLLELVEKHRAGLVALGFSSETPFGYAPTPEALAWLDDCLAKIMASIEAELHRRLN